MTRSVSGKAGKAGALGQARDHFRPQDEGEWGTGIASRFRAKQGPLFCTELAALLKIGFKKAAGDAAVAYHSLRTVLCMLSSHMDLSVCKVKISELKPHQFLPTKRSIIGEKEHDLITGLLALEKTQHFLPLRALGSPGEL